MAKRKRKFENMLEGKDDQIDEGQMRSDEMVSVTSYDENPDIVHLSDEYRPTKLADIVSELYDGERTVAYTVMEDKNFPDRHMIDFLLDVIMESYVFCKNEVDNSWNVVSKWFLDDFSHTFVMVLLENMRAQCQMQQMRNALKYGRKGIVLKLLPKIEQKNTSYMKGICRHESLKELLSNEDIRKYMVLCLKLTLLMNANDPPVHLECSGWKPIRDRQEEQEDLLQSAKSAVDANNLKPATSPTNEDIFVI
ncbi:hypothetical protein MAR_022496 [Mya arenaria]|uniref:Uncharacterized protein n=1 Tax=Mya arenaria TaxID=6604 RepID=A0ABY7DML1_MYAAR|nr:hypothetical protein MAR_022496 [Mya arenaria]